jgi:hypothetical protein
LTGCSAHVPFSDWPIASISFGKRNSCGNVMSKCVSITSLDLEPSHVDC